MEGGGPTVPLTGLQQRILALLAHGGRSDGYLAGGAALHLASTSSRFSDDIDFFHDSLEAVAASFERHRATLETAGYHVEIIVSQPGLIRARVSADDQATLVDWAHDSAWRFMPLVQDEMGGRVLHEVDLGINKVLALAGRDEARDFVDILYAHEHIMPLGAMVWAAPSKDPGFSPASLLDQLKRRGRHRPEEIARLGLAEPFELPEAKSAWRAALTSAADFIRERPHEEAGCLYYSPNRGRFVTPAPGIPLRDQGLVTHFGQPGGILPRVVDARG